MTKAMIFDLDGTLIDSLGDIAAAANRLLARHNRPSLSQSQVESLVGEGVNVLVQGAWDLTGDPMPASMVEQKVAEYLDLYLEHPTEHTIVFDGVPTALRVLRQAGWALGICTNKPDAITDRVLANLGLDQLVDTVVGGDFPNRKPHGDHVLETLRRLNINPGHSVFVGDSKTDVAAARHAGVPVICVALGYSHGPVEALGADVIVPDYRDPGFLERTGSTLIELPPKRGWAAPTY